MKRSLPSIRRRSFIAGTAAVLAGVAAPAHAARPTFRVAVATNEPWGTYHVDDLLDDVAARGGQLVLVVPDRSGVSPQDPVPVVTPEELTAWDPDLLVVTGATEWPTQVAAALPGVPVVASALAYMNPVAGPGAASLAPRLVKITAGSPAEAEAFAAHLTVDAHRVRVVGNPQLDAMPDWQPVAGTVLILTSVTHPDATGGAAPGTQLLLDAAHALQEAGRHVRVGLHPREDPTLWDAFEIATEGSLAASATAEVAVGIPGSIFPQLAAVGVPLVGVVDPALQVPDYLLEICTPAGSVAEVMEAVGTAEPLARQQLRHYVGPLGRAGATLAQVWFAASRRPAR